VLWTNAASPCYSFGCRADFDEWQQILTVSFLVVGFFAIQVVTLHAPIVLKTSSLLTAIATWGGLWALAGRAESRPPR
jgi:hypothetical protein